MYVTMFGMFSDLASLFHRCDQYRWVSKGVYSIKSSDHDFKKRSNWIDVEGAEKGTYLMHAWLHVAKGSTNINLYSQYNMIPVKSQLAMHQRN